MKERKAGLDLLRCTALLLVVTFHSYLNNGYYYEAQTGVDMFLAGSARWLSTACNGLFLMLTGWLKSRETGVRACWKGLPAVLVGYLIAAVISVPVRHFLLDDRQTLGEWILRILQVRGVYYGWYVEMYVGLILLSPFLNRLLEELEKPVALLLLAVLTGLTGLPGVLGILPDYWRAFYPVTYYILGALIRRLDIRLPPWLGLSGAGVLSCLMGLLTVLSTDKTIYEAAAWEFGDLPVMGIGFFLFASLHHLELPDKAGRLLRFGAGGCYGGYLLSHLMDAWCYRLFPGWNAPEYYGLLFLCVTVPVFTVSAGAGFLLESAAGCLTGRRRGR